MSLKEQDWWLGSDQRRAKCESWSPGLHLQCVDVSDSPVSHSLDKGIISAPLDFPPPRSGVLIVTEPLQKDLCRLARYSTVR